VAARGDARRRQRGRTIGSRRGEGHGGHRGALPMTEPGRRNQVKSVTFRDLKTLDDFAQVVEMERVIWGPGYDDVVPTSILAVPVHVGGMLIGAFDERRTVDDERRTSHDQRRTTNDARRDRMVGFVYSVPGINHGKPMQWSHMLGVLDEFRNDGIGQRLKEMQRDRTLAMGLDLIE